MEYYLDSPTSSPSPGTTPPPPLPPHGRGFSFSTDDERPFPFNLGFGSEKSLQNWLKKLKEEVEGKAFRKFQKETIEIFKNEFFKVVEPLRKEIEKFEVIPKEKVKMKDKKLVLRVRKEAKEMKESLIDRMIRYDLQVKKLNNMTGDFECQTFKEWSNACDQLPRYYNFVDEGDVKREFDLRMTSKRINELIGLEEEMTLTDLQKNLLDILPQKNCDYEELNNFITEQKGNVDTFQKVKDKLFAKFKQKMIQELYMPRALTSHEFGRLVNHFVSQEHERLSQQTFLDEKTSFSNPIQRLHLPPDSKVYIITDIHGDVRSVIEFLRYLSRQGVLDGFHLKNENSKSYIIFCGDYIDRGAYGAEVLYTVGRLKLANPEHVILIKGNHDKLSWEHFSEEIINKFEFASTQHQWANGLTPYAKKMDQMFDLFVQALYLGSSEEEITEQEEEKKKKKDYILVCHGGIDYFDPKPLLGYDSSSNEDRRSVYCAYLPNTLKKYLLEKHSAYEQTKVSFEMSKFTIHEEDSDKFIYKDIHDYTFFGKEATKVFLDACSCSDFTLLGVIRGHHHGGGMPEKTAKNFGLFNSFGVQWDGVEGSSVEFQDGDVWTLSIAPDSMNGKAFLYGDLTYVVLENNNNNIGWSLCPRHVKILRDDEMIEVVVKKMKALAVRGKGFEYFQEEFIKKYQLDERICEAAKRITESGKEEEEEFEGEDD